MHRQYSRMHETLFDLYTERDALPWYFRTIALACSWFALGGYIIFALIFTSAENNIKTSRTVLTALAGFFIVAGYAGTGAIAYYSRSLLFLFDAVLLPILTSSLMGVFVTVLNHALHRNFPVSTRVYIYVPLVTACCATIVTGVLGYITYRRLSKIKKLDRQRRQHGPRWDRGSYVSFGDAASTTELLPMNSQLPEDEAQRRQLLRLLLSREQAQSPGLRTSQSTYHINLPGDDGGYDGLQVVQPDNRPRSGSLPANPGRWNILSKMSRDRSPTTESFKNPRERRREEIERSSILLTPGHDSGWPQTPGSSQSQNWSGSARYA